MLLQCEEKLCSVCLTLLWKLFVAAPEETVSKKLPKTGKSSCHWFPFNCCFREFSETYLSQFAIKTLQYTATAVHKYQHYSSTASPTLWGQIKIILKYNQHPHICISPIFQQSLCCYEVTMAILTRLCLCHPWWRRSRTLSSSQPCIWMITTASSTTAGFGEHKYHYGKEAKYLIWLPLPSHILNIKRFESLLGFTGNYSIS